MKKILTVILLLAASACTPPIPYVTPTPVAGTPTIAAPTPVDATQTPSAVPPSPNAEFLPNPSLTAGAVTPILNPDVTVATEPQTICKSGWTSTVRPPVTYTEPLKIKQIAEYGYADTNLADYEEDHLVPLELGGSPTDPGNLWPEPRNTTPWNAGIKDQLENQLKLLVCSGSLDLSTAQLAIATDWVAAYQKYFPAHLLIAPTIVPEEP